MKILAPAKINLGLRILGRRADGFHEIETVFAEIDGLADELAFELREDGEITWNMQHGTHNTLCHPERSGAESKDPLEKRRDASTALGMTPVWEKEDDLSFRAAQLLQKKYGVQQGVSIQLTKNIPVGAGLGGGSSDAAATLKALNKLWQLNLNLDELEKCAAELGSDCAFFIRGGIQKGTGRGEILEQFSLPADFPRHAVLVCPEVSVNTAEAFASLAIIASDQRERGDLNEIASSASRNRNDSLDSQNDFEPVIFAQHPALAETKNWLLESGAEMASLSGSGSTVFGLFYEKPEIELPGVVHARIKA
jgi:4-diphosphocytidyl-2-C-methyl-D-erythritol kinase